MSKLKHFCFSFYHSWIWQLNQTVWEDLTSWHSLCSLVFLVFINPHERSFNCFHQILYSEASTLKCNLAQRYSIMPNKPEKVCFSLGNPESNLARLGQIGPPPGAPLRNCDSPEIMSDSKKKSTGRNVSHNPYLSASRQM